MLSSTGRKSPTVFLPMAWGFTRPLALLQQVERRAGVSRETFESEVSTLRTPVVLTGEGLDELTAHLGWATHIA